MLSLGIPTAPLWSADTRMRLPGFGMDHYYPDMGEEKLWVPEELTAKRRELRPIVVLFIGRRGSGKGIALTTTAYIQLRRYLAAHVPMKIGANYNVTFATYRDPYIVDRLQNFPPWARRIYLCIDEIGAAFPGMRSMAYSAITFTQLLGQIRKRAIEIGSTTRFPQILGMQHVMEIDLFVRCNARARLPDGRPRILEMEVWDFWGQWTDDTSRKYWPPTVMPPDWRLMFGNTHHICNMYRTEEVVAPSFSGARDSVIQQQWDVDEEDIPVILKKGQTSPRMSRAHEVEPPKNLEEAMSLVSGAFNINTQFDTAQRFGIKSKKDFAEWLRANGYELENRDHIVIARRAE